MKAFVIAAGLLATASAHATWQELWVNGVDQVGKCVRLPPSNSPVSSVDSTDIRCNVGGTKGMSGTCTVAAGQTVTVEMHQQPGDRNCANEAIGGAHHGPVIIYMSKVSDATTNDGSGSWFKIAQEGYVPATNTWADQTLNANCGKKTVTIPSTLAPGNYLLRSEIIALHSAGSQGGAQFYMSCFQIVVTGSGTKNPTGVSFPGAYKATDPGILINIYQSITSYPIPGPTAVFTG